MLRKLLKNKRAQNTAEYAILISLVVAGVIAMQTYAQRALQGKVRDASALLSDVGSDFSVKAGGETLAGTEQYEPYYLDSNYTVDRTSEDSYVLGQKEDGTGAIAMDMSTNRVRTGSQTSSYNRELFGVDSFLDDAPVAP
jgi:Flp pilus assembly pilin Flp